MQSENYSITTSVISGGGVPMASDNYQINPTLGQSSPLMDPADPPYSTSYDLYPGFWYTLEVIIPTCDDLASFTTAYGSITGDTNYSFACDLDGDDDVDGIDLAELAGMF